MRKLLSLCLIVFCAISCVENRKLEKPFIVIDKSFSYHGSFFKYYYTCQDKNGVRFEFETIKDEYNVGDIIK